MHHDTEFIELIMGWCLGIFSLVMLDGYLKFFPLIDDRKTWLVLPMLFLGMGPPLFFIVERRIHEKTGRLLRFLHAICAATVLIYCIIFVAGIFLLFLGMRISAYFT